MSFILDALKKSDAERQKRSNPGFSDIPQSRDRRQPHRWVWIVGGLLLVNLVALFVLLARPGPEPATMSAAEPRQDPSPADTVASRPFSDIVAEARRNQPETAPSPTQASRTARPESTRAAEPAQTQSRAARVEASNTFESMRADGTLQLPDLHLDIHVYSERSAERFVFINMKKYRENETLTEGPVVREIAPEGVILAHAGNVFLLPRD